MKRGIKILLIVLLVLVLLVVGYVAFTAYQLVHVAKAFQDNGFTSDVEALAGGDCSKIPLIESKYSEVESTLRSACLNPASKAAIQGYVKNTPLSGIDICAEIKNPNNRIKSALDLAKANCDNQSKV